MVCTVHLGQRRGARGGGLGVLPKILDKSVLPKVLIPDPVYQQERRKLIHYLRPKSEKRDSILGKNKK